MSLLKLEMILDKKLAELSKKQTLKGNELIISGIKPAAGEYGPRYYLKGHGKKEFLRMNSNSYLDLSMHREVIRAEEKAASKYGTGPGAVRFISGTCSLHIELEKKLARFHGKPAGMLFNSAYSAVVGVLSSIITKDSLVVSDALNHNSIINALRLSRPLAKSIYMHLNLDELEKSLDAFQGKAKRAIVVTDGIFSMRGDHAPLVEISEICKSFYNKYAEGVILVVDDSHGTGAFGTTGRGTEEYTGAKADLLLGTLGKAFGVNGGYIVSSKTMINYLRETAPLYIYSNPITPPEAAAAIKSLEILDDEEGQNLLKKLRKLSQLFKKGLSESGFETIISEHPIVPLLIRDTQKTALMTKYLFENNILATGLNFPVVPKGDEEIRFQISACHTEKDIEFVLEVLSAFN